MMPLGVGQEKEENIVSCKRIVCIFCNKEMAQLTEDEMHCLSMGNLAERMSSITNSIPLHSNGEK